MAILRGKIDVTKIDRDAMFKGEKGTYLDITIVLKDEPDQYGNDGMITQDIGKDRREAGERGAILGNARWVKRDDAKASRPGGISAKPQLPTSGAAFKDDEIPFGHDSYTKAGV
jgi:hypothetical protein